MKNLCIFLIFCFPILSQESNLLDRMKKLEEEHKKIILELLQQNQEILKQNQEILKHIFFPQPHFPKFSPCPILDPQCPEHCLNPKNLALGKTAKQSSTYPAGIPSKAVDGNQDNNWEHGSVSITAASGTKDWWEVDLGKAHHILQVVVYKRGDDGGGQGSHFWLMISITPFPPFPVPESGDDGILRFTHPDNVELYEMFNVQAAGRYVRIQKKGPGHLSLAEVEVFGH